jgi:hypothetical protein
LPKLKSILIHYAISGIMPDEKCVTLGVVLYDPDLKATGFCEVRFAPHWEDLVKERDPDADLEVIAATLQEVKRGLEDRDLRAETLTMMTSSWSNTIRVSAPKGYTCQNPNDAIDAIASAYFH